MRIEDETLPLDYEECCNQMLAFGVDVSPSEIHGLLSGVVCTGLKIRPDSMISLVLKHVDADDCAEPTRQSLLAMYQFIEQEMASADSRYTLFLPDDETDMTQRVRALAGWCQGFLVGFGTASGQAGIGQFSAETEEALKDIVSITSLSDEFSQDEDESNENAYAELVEYLKVAVLLMSSEFLAAVTRDA